MTVKRLDTEASADKLAANRRQYLETSYAGRKLQEQHSLEEVGVWQVLGEDPNCDLGGSHHQPDLGTYEGRLSDVIDLVVMMPGFWQWGAGGDIRAVKRPIRVTPETVKKSNAAKARIKALQDEIEALKGDVIE